MSADLDRLWNEAVKDNGNIVPSDVRQLIGEVRRLRDTVERARALLDTGGAVSIEDMRAALDPNDDDPVGDTHEAILSAATRVYAEAASRYESAVQGTDWTERKAAHDELQRAGEMYARAYAGYHYGRGGAALATPKEDA